MAWLPTSLGVFTMPLGRIGPEGARLITTAGRLGLVVRGDHGGVVTTNVALPDPGGAAIGEVLLSMELEPLPRSIVAALINLVDDLSVKPEEATLPDGTTVAVSLGEEACTFTFPRTVNVRRFPYKVPIRLVEPRTTIVSRAFIPPLPPIPPILGQGRMTIAPLWNAGFLSVFDAQSRFVNRVPVDKPISVDGFRGSADRRRRRHDAPSRRSRWPGRSGSATSEDPRRYGREGALALGNLVYSLPLAPGEQQRVAVVESMATAGGDGTRSGFDIRPSSSARRCERGGCVVAGGLRLGVRGACRGQLELPQRSGNGHRAGAWPAGSGRSWGPVAIGVGAAGGGGELSNERQHAQPRSTAPRNYTCPATEDMHRSVERGGQRAAPSPTVVIPAGHRDRSGEP